MQTRLRDFKEPLSSFIHNICNLGLHNPGRYVGFDEIQLTSDLGFTLVHSADAPTYKDPNGISMGPLGVYVTPQGMIIMEDNNIPGFAVDSNAGNNSERYDLLVANHQYQEVDGGNAATYSIIKGPLGSTALPALTNPNYQTILGVLKLRNLTLNPLVLNAGPQVEWIPSRTPDSGDARTARLNETNVYEKLQQFKATQMSAFTTVGEPSDCYTLPNSGNSLQIIGNANVGYKKVKGFRFGTIGNPQDGTEINMYIDANVHFMQAVITTQAINANYRPINIPGLLKTGTVDGVPACTFDKGKPAIIKFIKFGDVWYLANVQRFGGVVEGTDEDAGTSSSGFKIHYSGNYYLGDKPDTTDQLVTITFATPGILTPAWAPFPNNVTDANDINIIGNIRSVGTDWNKDNDVVFAIREKSLTGFKLALREVSSNIQNLRFDFIVVIPD